MPKKKKIEEEKEVVEEVEEPKKDEVEERVKEEVSKALKEQKELDEKEAKEKKKKKIKTIIRVIIVLIIIAIAIFLLFNRKFDVTFKYNNGEEDHEIQVKFWRKIPKDEVKEFDDEKFIGYFETYYLSGEQIETIKKDEDKEKEICKEKFKLNTDKTKCIAEDEFDFEKTRIRKNTTIEALWKGEAEPAPTPKPEPEPTPEPKKEEPKKDTKDYGTISISSDKKCIIGNEIATITAKVSNAKDSRINWTKDACLQQTGSGNSITVVGDACNKQVTVTGKLNNGSSSSATLTHESQLVVTLVDYEGKSPYVSDGEYYGVKTITTNIPAVITSSSGVIIGGESSTPRTSATTRSDADSTITVKTPCGQVKTYKIKAVIN